MKSGWMFGWWIVFAAVGSGGCYLYGDFCGRSDADTALQAGEDLVWHLLRKEVSPTESRSPLNGEMTVVVHRSWWSFYQRGYVDGHNEKTLEWMEWKKGDPEDS